MKRTGKILSRAGMLSLLAIALVSCTDNELVPADDLSERMVTVSVSAGVGEKEGTRTFIASVTGKNHWKIDDEIGVWPLDGNGRVATQTLYKFKVTAVKTDPTKCILSGQLPQKYENARLAAIYPYQADASLKKIDSFDVPYVDEDGVFRTMCDRNYEYQLTATVPRVQKAVKDSYDPDAYISIAVMDNAGDDLNFRNACTLIKFTAPKNTGKTITAVKLESRDETELDRQVNDLTGKFQAAYITGETSAVKSKYTPVEGYSFPDEDVINSVIIANMKVTGQNYHDVTLEAPEGFEPGADYYMVVRNFRSWIYKKGGTLPSTGGGNWYENWLGKEYHVFAENQNITSPLYGYDDDTKSYVSYNITEASTRMDDVVINVAKGAPMLKSGHILSFTASDGTVCTRKFKAAKTEETESVNYKVIPLNELSSSGMNYWYWVTKKTVTTTSGVDFERSSYKPLTFADNESNWKDKFVAP